MYTILEFDDVISTSSLLKEHYASFPHFTVIRTDYQSHGRGQFDRIWEAKKGQNLLMSLLLKDIKIKQIDHLKKETIDALIEVLSMYGVNAFFKSPNDLYVGDKKICGILIETQTSDRLLDYVVIGIGLNINQRTFGDYPATSLALELHHPLEIKEVFDHVLKSLEKNLLKGK